MRALVLVTALAMMTGTALAKPAHKPAAPPAKAPAETTWIAICFGEDAQYTQTINGAGYFHLGTGQRSYQTQKLVQSQYNASMVCAVPDPKAPHADSNVALVCADLTAKTISVMSQSTAETKRVLPQNATVFCKARIDVLNQ
jgi:hypothetical protein